MDQEPWPASFLCAQCHTRVSLTVHHFAELRRWTCAGCLLTVEGRPMPARYGGVSGIQMWLGGQLVADLFGDDAERVRAILIAPVGPALAEAVGRVVPDKAVLVVSLGVLVRVLLACEGLPLTPEGVRLIELARAGDLAGLARVWRVSIGAASHGEEGTAVMLEGPPGHHDRAQGRWFAQVLVFIFREEGDGFRLGKVTGWEGSWQGPPR